MELYNYIFLKEESYKDSFEEFFSDDLDNYTDTMGDFEDK